MEKYESLKKTLKKLEAGEQPGIFEIMLAIEDIGAYVQIPVKKPPRPRRAANESADHLNHPHFQRCQSCGL